MSSAADARIDGIPEQNESEAENQADTEPENSVAGRIRLDLRRSGGGRNTTALTV